MKKNWVILAGLLISAQAFAVANTAGLPTEAQVEYLMNQGFGGKVRLGSQITRKVKRVLKAKYDYAVNGGAIGTIWLKDVDGKDAVLPANAVVTDVIVDVQTNLLAAGATVMSVGAEGTAD
ncbi:MAG: hypothetical protein KGL39_59450, partial [Patescibacteria group bacterium]|nr:hypothetical protein [Patescibacteria group bacterium]